MSEPFIGEIRTAGFGFAPRGWAMCNGQTLPINQNQALFSLLGTQYGGDGVVNFRLPDLRSRVPIHAGNGHTQGESGGQDSVTLTQAQMPRHTHTLSADATNAPENNSASPSAGSSLGQTIGSPGQGAAEPASLYSSASPTVTLAPGAVGNFGGSQPHENRQPYLAVNFIIALEGIFPSRT